MRQSCPKSCPSLQHPEAGFYRKSCKAGEVIIMERNHTSSIVFVTKGSCVLDSNERMDYHVGENHVLLCYQDYYYEFKAETDLELVICYFANPGAACNMGALSKQLRKKADFQYEFKALPFHESFDEFLSLLDKYLDSDIRCSHMHHSMMELVFINFRFFYSQEEQLNFFYNLFGHTVSFIALIENNRSKAKNLKQLAEMCGYTINQFNEIFRRHVPDKTPREWIQDSRRVEILNDIKYTDIRLYDLSEKYGFSGPGNFCAYCKREFGELPSHIRRRFRDMGDEE